MTITQTRTAVAFNRALYLTSAVSTVNFIILTFSWWNNTKWHHKKHCFIVSRQVAAYQHASHVLVYVSHCIAWKTSLGCQGHAH